MNVQKLNGMNSNINFGHVKMDPNSYEILKPLQQQLNALAKDCDVQIGQYKSSLGGYTDYGIIVQVAEKDVVSKNIIKNFLNKIVGANYPAAAGKVAKRCIMNDNGKTETLFEAENDLIRTRVYKCVKTAIEEHSSPVFPKLQKFKPFDNLIKSILTK